jgi:hypothetical protein
MISPVVSARLLRLLAHYPSCLRHSELKIERVREREGEKERKREREKVV